MSGFFEYAERNGFALFPCRADTKIPAARWKEESTHDRAQWESWRTEGYNLAVNCAASGIIMIDVDASKVPEAEAWQAFTDLAAAWGMMMPLPKPYLKSARGGWHIPFRRPADLRPEDIRGGGTLISVAAGEVVGFKNRGYCIAAESTFEGKPYLLYPDAPEPYDCPAPLLDLILLPVVEHTASGQVGISEPTDVARLVAFLDSHGEFDPEPEWFKALGAIKLALGDTEDGLMVARQITREDATDEALISRWNRLSESPKPGQKPYTIGSLIKRAEELGQKFRVSKSTKMMFQGVVAQSTLPPNATPLIGGGPHVPQIVAPEYSEIEIADRFANDYASGLRYITSRKVWLYWTGKRWRIDETDYVANLARGHCRQEAALCASRPGNNNARTLCSDRTVQAVLRLARTDQRIATRVDDWDQDQWLMGTPDGVVDLRTGTLRAARPEDHITKSTAVSPGGDCPLWLAFLNRVTNDDADLTHYLQKLAGYSCTGSTRQQELYFLHGPGKTGKGTYSHATQGVLGDYHRTTAIETLTESRQDRHPAEVAVLQGARLVTCSETERGRNWAESRIKQWTGEDPISARFMNGNPFDFLPTFKLFISGNYKPHLRPDSAMRRRIRLIPFVRVIPDSEVDADLGSKLRNEWSGILGWMIAGAVAWQREGLKPPACVVDATRDYMETEAEDTLTMWLDDQCDTSDPTVKTPHGKLYASYRSFASIAGEPNVLSSERLGKALGEMGYRGVRTGKEGRLRVGIKLVPSENVGAPYPWQVNRSTAANHAPQ